MKAMVCLLGLAVVGGFLTKLSFLLFVAVLILDQGLESIII